MRRYGYEPQRLAVWIYWQALQLLRKGVPFSGPPTTRRKDLLEERLKGDDECGSRRWSWRSASGFPWTAG